MSTSHHPPPHSKFNKKYYTPLSHHLRYLGGWVVIIEYQLQCQICAVANRVVLRDAQYIVLVDQHLVGWKEEGKYSSGLLEDEKTREKMRGCARGDNRGGATHDSIVRNPMIITGCSGQKRNGAFVPFIPTLIIIG